MLPLSILGFNHHSSILKDCGFLYQSLHGLRASMALFRDGRFPLDRWFFINFTKQCISEKNLSISSSESLESEADSSLTADQYLPQSQKPIPHLPPRDQYPGPNQRPRWLVYYIELPLADIQTEGSRLDGSKMHPLSLDSSIKAYGICDWFVTRDNAINSFTPLPISHHISDRSDSIPSIFHICV
jgi:hypothetical protein